MQKAIILFCLIIGMSALMASTPPERVLPLSQSIYPVEYYQSQLKIWKKELNDDATNAAAWLNYYTAARNINILNAYELNDLDAIAADVQKQIPNTFEGYYIQYWQSNFFERDYQSLLKAHELAPDRSEIYHDLMIYYKMKNNAAAVANYGERLLNTGKLSAGILDWNYNALMSVGEHGILLTHGDNDTYPAWVLQEVKNIRKDVEVINLYLLLAEDTYRQRVFKQLSIPNAYTGLPNQELNVQLISLIDHLLKYIQRPLYFGVATPSNLRNELSDHLYLTGLAFQHSKQQMDNISMLDYHYQKEFRKELLRTPLAYDASQSVVDHMNMNYIPSFALLYRYYKNNNRKNEAEETKNLITAIATRANKLESVADIFTERKTLFGEKPKSPLDLRTLDKELMPLSSQLYAAATEVTNAQYRIFLHDLLDQNKYDLLKVCRIYPTDWVSLLPEEYQNLSKEVYFKQGHPEGDEMPIVNISYQAAQLYCQWLTEQYNHSDHRKKRFKKVVFRLPTKEEWILAAKGRFRSSVYPWGGPDNKNAKGCLLANFNPGIELTEENKEVTTGIPADDDGGFFTVKVDAYYPNDLGFYNIAGNAAEMIEEEGVTMGGGWNDAAYYMQIGVEHTVDLPNPNTGFRIFMDVIEE